VDVAYLRMIAYTVGIDGCSAYIRPLLAHAVDESIRRFEARRCGLFPITLETYSVTSPSGGMRSIVMSRLNVCLFVCLSARITRKPHCRTLPLVYIAYGRGSLLIWQRCDTLCTSGFVDDGTFSRSGSHIMRILKRRWNTRITAEITTKFCWTIKTGSTHCELHTEGGGQA